MKFHLVDRIDSIEPGRRIVTVKSVSLAEEYLADHFPAFPVLPGVMMVEALVQAGAWLARIQQDFRRSIIVLRAARNVKYASFVQPGGTLRCEVEAKSIDDDSAKLIGSGYVGDQLAVSGRLELRCFCLADTDPARGAADEMILEQIKQRFRLARGPEALQAAG
jgi:3-hydroxyacyl-[acyl-carrier-protein] dehydratase